MTFAALLLAAALAPITRVQPPPASQARPAPPAAPAAQPLLVRRMAPVESRRIFDPATPPPSAPKDGDRDAFTDIHFRCATRLDVRTLSQHDDGTQLRQDLVVDGVRMDLKLELTQWLPASPTPSLQAHEDGHRRIALAFYEGAEAVARERAQPWVGRRLVAYSKDAGAGTKEVIKDTARKINQEWIDTMLARQNAAQAEFDALTNHGLNDAITAEDAVAQVLARHLSSPSPR